MASVDSGNGGDIESQAAAWAIRSAERPLDDTEQQQLEAWLALGSRNLGAYVRAQAMWCDIDRVAALDGGSRVEPPHEELQPARWQRYAIAASVALVMIGGLAYDRLPGRVATDHGEIRQIALDDGSTVFLNSDAVMQVRYNDGERRIFLRKGEASFRVAHNATRPFIVSAEGVSVRAVGTEFVVGVDDTDVSVTVADGIVAIDDRGVAAPPRYLRRNEQFVAASTGPRKVVLDGGEVERRLAWRQGLLMFRGQTLGAAAADVNRYAAQQIVIADPTLARAEFMGVFRVGDSRAFAEAAAQAFNGKVVEDGGTLRLERQQNSPSH